MQQQIKPAYRVPECIEYQSVQNIRVPEGMEYQSKKVDSFRWDPRVTSKELDTEMEEYQSETMDRFRWCPRVPNEESDTKPNM